MDRETTRIKTFICEGNKEGELSDTHFQIIIHSPMLLDEEDDWFDDPRKFKIMDDIIEEAKKILENNFPSVIVKVEKGFDGGFSSLLFHHSIKK